MSIPATTFVFKGRGQNIVSGPKADRIGVLASVLCAIHCAVTPVLLIVMPAFGKAWSHPATHWGMALVALPIAGFTMTKGYQRHRRKAIIAIGCFGILFVGAGALAPYLESPAAAEGAVSTGCVDSCCPSLVQQEDGDRRLHIPMASILTTLGGLCLIGIHMGNLCCCPACRRDKSTDSLTTPSRGL